MGIALWILGCGGGDGDDGDPDMTTVQPIPDAAPDEPRTLIRTAQVGPLDAFAVDIEREAAHRLDRHPARAAEAQLGVLGIDRQVGQNDVALRRAADGGLGAFDPPIADDRVAAAGPLGDQLELEVLGHRLTST